MLTRLLQVDNWRKALHPEGTAWTNVEVWKDTVMLKHAGGCSGEDEALRVGNDEEDHPVGPARSGREDFRGQWDPLDAQLQGCWQRSTDHKTPSPYLLHPHSLFRNLLEVCPTKQIQSGKSKGRERGSNIGQRWEEIENGACTLSLKCSQYKK